MDDIIKTTPALQKLKLRSESVQDIILQKQSFTSRWALLIFLVVFLILFAATWFIKYPDIIQANAILTSANAPKEIVPLQQGKLIRLFVSNDEKVDSAQVIGWIESTASHGEVVLLSEILEKSINFISINKTDQVSKLFDKPFHHLGELQSPYQQFITAWQQFNDYLVNGYYYKKKHALFEDYNFLKSMHENLIEQKKMTADDLSLTQENFEANDTLFKEKVISRQDMRDEKSKLIGKQMSVPQLNVSLLTNENQQVGKQKEIDELEHTISQQKIIFLQALQTLKSMADDWEKKFIIKAATTGKIAFLIPLQVNQFIQANKIIGYVNPSDSRYFAQVTLPQNNFGKIDTGQKVQLRFDAYPYAEFGQVEGKLSYISQIPSDSGFLANIELQKGLKTNHNKEIQYRSGLKSQALIITKNLRLLQRFYYSVLKGIQR
ncbi:MAG: HlyD family efflux transporter periplasmic adaptor subunit [Bacteroidetes bacterium]|nr:HlyD family efflux transporter periplasmic adaptor subunit [Bacteroidota bacterium]